MDVRHINAFIEAVQTVFKIMMSADTVIGKPFVKEKDHKTESDLVAVIDLSGDVVGFLVLCFSEQTGLNIAQTIAGEAMGKDDSDLHDALGEVVNMIAGQAKSKFEGLHTSISTPYMVANTQLYELENGKPTLVLPCDSTLGRFRLEVTMQVNEKPSEKPATASQPSVH